MNRDRVTSSNVASVGYDPATLTLEVEFKNGSIYQYFNVPRGLYKDLMAAASVGGFLDKHIKKPGYRYIRL